MPHKYIRMSLRVLKSTLCGIITVMFEEVEGNLIYCLLDYIGLNGP